MFNSVAINSNDRSGFAVAARAVAGASSSLLLPLPHHLLYLPYPGEGLAGHASIKVTGV